MKLFIWKEFYKNYAYGVGMAIAKDADSAREMIMEQVRADVWYEAEEDEQDPDSILGRCWRDLQAEPEVIDLDAPWSFYRSGGE